MYRTTRRRWIPVMLLALATAALAATAFAAPDAGPAAAAPQPLTAETMWQLARLGDTALSPDGRYAVVEVTRFSVADDKGNTDLWLVPTDGGPARQLTSADGSEREPAWSPDGRWIAFTAQRGADDVPQLYVIPTDMGEARRLTDVPTGTAAPKWFPDSKRIAFVSRVWSFFTTWDEQARKLKDKKDRKASALVYDSARMKYWDHWVDERESHVFFASIDGGTPGRITSITGLELPYRETGRNSFDIAPTGDEVAVTADSSANPGVVSNLDVHTIPANSTAGLNISPDNPQGDFDPLYSPDGRYIVFGRKLVKGFYGDRTRLVLYDRADGKRRVMAPDFDYGIASWTWGPDSRCLYVVVDQQGCERVMRLGLDDAQPTPLTSGGTYSGLQVDRGGKFLTALRQGFTEPPTLVRIDLPGGTVTPLSRFNDALLQNVRWGEVRSVTYAGAGGDPIQMWIVLPPDYQPGQKRPLFLLIHGGPHQGMTDAFQFRWNAQVFAGWGYVCAWPNFHGSSGFGNAFTASILGNWADAPYEDVIKATDWLVAQGLVDPVRLAAGGGSYGGYLSTVILGRPNPYKALVAHAAVYNLYTQYASDYGATERSEQAPHFWDDPAFVAHNSPHLAAGAFKTPTLVVHGEKDFRVYPGNGLELFATLQARGVPSRLIYYPDENHWVLKPNNSLFWYAEVRRWLEQWVK